MFKESEQRDGEPGSGFMCPQTGQTLYTSGSMVERDLYPKGPLRRITGSKEESENSRGGTGRTELTVPETLGE